MQYPKVKRTANYVFTALALLCATCLSQASPVSASDYQRELAAQAKQLTVYEGLPRHIGEERSLEQELSRQDVIIFCKQAFYSPGSTLANDSSIREVITSPSSVKEQASRKRHAPFHPDYAIVWKNNGIRHYVFVSLEGGEIIYCSPKSSHQYQLTAHALQQLKVALKPFAKKRPGS